MTVEWGRPTAIESVYANLYSKLITFAGKQAVLVLSCDNAHMSEEVLVEPGLVMIFAHGIE